MARSRRGDAPADVMAVLDEKTVFLYVTGSLLILLYGISEGTGAEHHSSRFKAEAVSGFVGFDFWRKHICVLNCANHEHCPTSILDMRRFLFAYCQDVAFWSDACIRNNLVSLSPQTVSLDKTSSFLNGFFSGPYPCSPF